MAIRTLKELRAALPHMEIEDNGYDIGYWLRVAGERRPHPTGPWMLYVSQELHTFGSRKHTPGIMAGWEDADRELTAA